MKIAQVNDSPVITTPVRSEQVVKGIWDKYFANKHADIVNKIRGLLKDQSNIQMRTALLRAFPLAQDQWKNFAYMPMDLTLEQLNDGVVKLNALPEIHLHSDITNALNLYMQQYKMLLNALNKSQTERRDKARKAPVRSTSTNADKIREVQKLLRVNVNGIWDEATDAAFLNWLNKNGWGKYVRNNRFAGTLDAAIEILSAQLIKKPDVKTMPIEEGLPPLVSNKRTERLLLLKKLFG